MNYLETKQLYNPKIQGLRKKFMLPSRGRENKGSFVLYILFLGICILFFGMSEAQAQDFKFGAKAGLNLSTLQPDLTDPTTRTSFHIGGIAEISIMDALSIQPELLYSSQGVKDKSDDDEVIRLGYLTLPVMAKYYVVDNLSIEAGPQFGLLLSAEREDDGETTDLKDISKSSDIGLAFGLGYKLESGLNFGLRYYLGSDINDIEEDPDKIANRVFQISVGYFFN